MGHTPLRSTIVVTAAASLFACHPTGIDDAAETDMVVTRQAKDYDYSRNRTYDIPEEIADLCTVDRDRFPPGGGGEGGEAPRPPNELDCNEITHVFDKQILDEIRRNFERLGYVRVEAGEKPDVALLVGALSSNNWVAYTYYPWFYYPYYPPYYGWDIYYPYYPTTTVVNYPTGTLMIELASIQDADPEQERIPVAWTASIAGLLAQSDDVDTVSRIDRSLDQAFAQSPYLKVGDK